MRKILRILRRERGGEESYWEDFVFETDQEAATAAAALSALREKDRTGTGERPFRPIAWDHSCLQKKCGACAMRIQGKPCLACDTRLSSFREETIVIEPLKKFPVIEDLLVDRTSLMDRLLSMEAWYEGEALQRAESLSYEASRCLQCGLCLEVCPGFQAKGPFAGMAGMTPFARILARLPEGQRKKAARTFDRAVYEGCGKSLACREICPAGIDLERLLVKSTAAAVWRRWKTFDRE